MDPAIDAAIERAALASADATRATLRAIALLSAASHPSTVAPSTEPDPPGLVSGPAIDRALGFSPATRYRLLRAGLPHETVGARSHFDVGACKAWLAARGKKPSALPKRASRNEIDVTGLASRAGIRVS